MWNFESEKAKEIAVAEDLLIKALNKQLQAPTREAAKEIGDELDQLADRWTQLRVSAAGERKEVVRRFMSQEAQDRIERRDAAADPRPRVPQPAKRSKKQKPVVSGSVKRSNDQEAHEASGSAKRPKV